MATPAFLEQLLFWHWWAFAVALLMLEALLPGAFFLWMAVAAGVVGALLLLLPMISWEIQLLIFSLTAVIAVVCWLTWAKKHPAAPAQPSLNRRGAQYINQQFSTVTPVRQGRGKLMLDGTIWMIQGPDCEANTRIKITGIDGGHLQFDIDSQ